MYSYERTSVYFYYYYCICIQTKAYKKTGGPKNSGVRVIYSHTVREWKSESMEYTIFIKDTIKIILDSSEQGVYKWKFIFIISFLCVFFFLHPDKSNVFRSCFLNCSFVMECTRKNTIPRCGTYSLPFRLPQSLLFILVPLSRFVVFTNIVSHHTHTHIKLCVFALL